MRLRLCVYGRIFFVSRGIKSELRMVVSICQSQHNFASYVACIAYVECYRERRWPTTIERNSHGETIEVVFHLVYLFWAHCVYRRWCLVSSKPPQTKFRDNKCKFQHYLKKVDLDLIPLRNIKNLITFYLFRLEFNRTVCVDVQDLHILRSNFLSKLNESFLGNSILAKYSCTKYNLWRRLPFPRLYFML